MNMRAVSVLYFDLLNTLPIEESTREFGTTAYAGPTLFNPPPGAPGRHTSLLIPMASLIQKEPFRSLYVCSKVAVVAAKVPLWTLLYCIGADRPRPSWTLKKTLVVNALRELIGT
jgi:hypothetical protein